MEKKENRERPRRRSLFVVYFVMLALLVVTVIGVRLPLNTVVHDVLAFGFSIASAALTVMIFMEVRYSRGVVRVFAGAGLAWLFLLFLLSLMDFFSRAWRY